jgi:hypothetical protein
MAHRRDARLTRLETLAEARETRRLYAQMAAECHLDPDDLMREGERFLSQPLAAKLREIDALYAECLAENVPWDDYGWIRATVIREHRTA